MRRCRFEQMEPRQLLAASPIQIGAVYFEDAGGEDVVGDRFQITFSGGAPGTQLTQLVIETDKNSNGTLDMGDCFFDTEPTGMGAFGSVGFAVVGREGIDSFEVSVSDGGDRLTLDFVGFDPGETFLFTIDVDEMGFLSPNAVAEGGEFEGSRLLATFEADHFAVAQGMDLFIDDYDAKLTASKLNLPPDDYFAPPALPVPIQTAAAIFPVQQEPLPITISGTVFVDADMDNVRDSGESPIAGVEVTLLELVEGDYVSTGKTTLTGSNGGYQFDGVLPGTYRVVETQPAGYLSVGAQAGTVDGVTRGEVFSLDVITDVELLGGDDSIHNDFGEVRPASLGGHVYHDADDDGIFDTSETGIGGVLVRIERVDDIIIDPGDDFPDDPLVPWEIAVQPTVEVFTNADGSWSVGNLLPGEYLVTEVTPDGYFDGKDAAGTAGGAAHNPGDLIDGIVLAGGQAGENYNFGELLPGGLCGYVYVDVNNNGLRETGEEGIPGVELILLDADGNPTGDTAWTDAEGHYCFPGLHPGVYGITEVQPDGYQDGLDTPGILGGVAHNPGDRIDLIPLGSGQAGKEYNFGERLLVGISGYVYADNDNDGVKDSGEAGIAGVTLTLLDAGGNATGTTTVTYADGFYRFENLPPGTYGVAEAQPSGYYDGLDAPGNAGGVAHNPGDSITGAVLDGGIVAVHYDFGELRPANLRGNVFVDLDGDLTTDAGEKRIGGVTLYLLDASGKRIASTQTNANGEYQFTNLAPGTYGVEEIQPVEYLDGNERLGSAGGVLAANDLMTTIVLAPGAKGVDYNFCEIVPATISGYVFQDGPTVRLLYNQPAPDPATIRDGKFTADDTPIAGVMLALGDGSGAPILDAGGRPITTVTDARGYYEFTGLAPDVYTILETQPTEYVDSIDTAGSVGGIAVNPSD
ncbi:MAG: carboxypeptidase regulatory-like domain-containing protein, partial [Planctomycetia bacterium]|nr:carboxypeptidase regulatory-like domain-containing protein [Planctomycetia bacterium]